MDGMGVWQVATRPLCVRMTSNLYQGAKEGEVAQTGAAQ